MLAGTAVEQPWHRHWRALLCLSQSFIFFVQVFAVEAQAETHEGFLAYVEGHYDDASRVLRSQADAGDVDAQFLMARIAELGLAGRADEHAAAVWYLMAARAGDPAAQLSIGLMYAEGRGLEWNFLEAYVWLTRAMVGFPKGAGREEAAEARRLVRSVLRPEELLRAERRLLRALG
ncbi:MAG: tetratricopeptide repeat protein [Geminicoccaceae bacterium]